MHDLCADSHVLGASRMTRWLTLWKDLLLDIGDCSVDDTCKPQKYKQKVLTFRAKVLVSKCRRNCCIGFNRSRRRVLRSKSSTYMYSVSLMSIYIFNSLLYQRRTNVKLWCQNANKQIILLKNPLYVNISKRYHDYNQLELGKNKQHTFN
jgi:hypothetical protein